MNADDWQVVTAISSAVIALCALVFSIWQGMVARKHNKLSVRPHLSTWSSADEEKGFYSFEIINNGIGPAIVEEATVKVDGKPIAGKAADAVENAVKILFADLRYRANHSYFMKGDTMAPNERCGLIELQFSDEPPPSAEVIARAMKRVVVEITYKSFYGETFHFSSKDEKASKPS